MKEACKMEEDDRKKIQGNYTELVRDLRVQDVQDFLFQNGILSEEDLETINIRDRGITPQEGVRRLLHILKKRGGQSFVVFIDSLRTDYADLAEKIWTTDTSEIVLCDDEVDNKTEVLRILKEQLEMQTRLTMKFMDEISELKKKADDHDNLKAKYVELDMTFKEIGITEKEAKDLIKDFFQSGREMKFEGRTSNGSNVRDDLDPDQPDEAHVGRSISKIGDGDHGELWPEPDTPADFTDVVARTLGMDIAYYVAHDCTEYKPAPNAYCVTLRRMAKEVIDLHSAQFSEFLERLFVNTGNGYQTLVDIADIMFDGEPTWGRIVVLYAFGAWLAKYYYQTGSTELAGIVGNFIGFYISRNHKDWIEAQGGWDNFNEFWKEQHDTASTASTEDGQPENRRDKLWNKVLMTSVMSAGLIALISLVTKR